MNSLLPSLYTPRNKIKLAGVGSQESVEMCSPVHSSPTPVVAGSTLLIVPSAVVLTAIFIITHCPHPQHAFFQQRNCVPFQKQLGGSQSQRRM